MSHEDWDNGSWTSVLKRTGSTLMELDENEIYTTPWGKTKRISDEGDPPRDLRRRAGEAAGSMSLQGGAKDITEEEYSTDDTERQQDASGQQQESWKPYQGTKAERIAWGVDKPEEVKPVLGSKRLGGWKEKLQAFGGDDTARASIDARRKEQENRKQQELIDRRTKTIEGYQGKGAVGQAAHALGDQMAHITPESVKTAGKTAGQALGLKDLNPKNWPLAVPPEWKQKLKQGAKVAGKTAFDAATLKPYQVAGKKIRDKAIELPDKIDEKAYQTQLRQMQDAAKKPPGPTDEEQETQVAEQLQQKDLEAQIASGKVPRKPMSQEEAVSLASDYGGGAGKEYIKPPDYQKIAQELREVNQKIAEVYDKHSDNEEMFLEERKKILEEQKQLMESVQE
jgi:hypothetical protein